MVRHLGRLKADAMTNLRGQYAYSCWNERLCIGNYRVANKLQISKSNAELRKKRSS